MFQYWLSKDNKKVITHDPGCAVKEAVEAGEISYDRYSSYLGMLDEEGKYR